MGMTERQFLECRIGYFVTRLYGLRDAQREQMRMQFEVARYMAQKSLAPYMKHTPPKFWDLPWDKQHDVEMDWDAFNEMMNKRFPGDES
jgi:hypothetical protein